MGWRDRAARIAEEQLNVSVVPADELGALREDRLQLETFREDASELAWHSLDYFSGRPHEMRPEKRARLAQKARVAFWEDPLAGAEADHYANFALGRGVPIPQAKKADEQRIIDEAWKDPNNQDKLTSFDALRAFSNELRSGANVFPVAFVADGRVKLGYLNADLVTDIVPDPEDEDRPLYYVTRVRKIGWDFAEDRPKRSDELEDGVLPKVIYYPHWRNVEEARKERDRRGEEALDEPPKEKLGEGLVYHCRVNRVIKQQFGSPPWRRTLRFYTAMNRFTEARVAMAQASASFVAKRISKGGSNDVIKAAKSILNQAGEIGSARSAREAELGRGGPPPRPASIWNENESQRLESLSLNSGAANAVQDGMIIRGAATAPSGFGQHYFGEAGNANLATASALELPALMAVGAWQEVLESVLRWFTDLALQEAARAGRLGGTTSKPVNVDKALQELSLFEADERQELKDRTGAEFEYTLAMPYPGRRNLPDVTNFVSAVFAAIPLATKSEKFTDIMLNFLFTHGMELEDPASLTEEVLAELKKAAEQEAQAAAAAGEDPGNPPPDGQPQGPAGLAPKDPQPADAKSTYGERRRGTVMQQSWLPDDLRGDADQLALDVADALRRGATEPAVLAAAGVNGHGHA